MKYPLFSRGSYGIFRYSNTLKNLLFFMRFEFFKRLVIAKKGGEKKNNTQ